MKIWIDAQLSPALALWLERTFDVTAEAVRDLGLRDATDLEIFKAARRAFAVVMSKDRDFVDLVSRMGTPPQVIWLTCGNTTNARLQHILGDALPAAIGLLDQGEPIVEISDIMSTSSFRVR